MSDHRLAKYPSAGITRSSEREVWAQRFNLMTFELGSQGTRSGHGGVHESVLSIGSEFVCVHFSVHEGPQGSSDSQRRS